MLKYMSLIGIAKSMGKYFQQPCKISFFERFPWVPFLFLRDMLFFGCHGYVLRVRKRGVCDYVVVMHMLCE